ncbi:hypothetical protein FXO38_09283 [Capsicum annuum]|nr:hypothetical protein FXO38_09283 [Capsicum annuum]
MDAGKAPQLGSSNDIGPSWVAFADGLPQPHRGQPNFIPTVKAHATTQLLGFSYLGINLKPSLTLGPTITPPYAFNKFGPITFSYPTYQLQPNKLSNFPPSPIITHSSSLPSNKEKEKDLSYGTYPYVQMITSHQPWNSPPRHQSFFFP